jgi:DNA-binding NtrC family response regulator
MKALQSDLHRNEPIPSPARSELPLAARISEPARTVLVVDDEAMVRDLETEVLRLQGYNVLAAGSAAEALRMAASTATIHLLITDLMMPEVDGLELTRRFRVMHPNVPVLMVSGSLPLLHAMSEPDLQRFDFLAKPYQLNELIQKVRTLLEAPIPLPT